MAAIEISPTEATLDATGGNATFVITNTSEKRVAFKVNFENTINETVFITLYKFR